VIRNKTLPNIASSDVKYKHGQKLSQERRKSATVEWRHGSGLWSVITYASFVANRIRIFRYKQINYFDWFLENNLRRAKSVDKFEWCSIRLKYPMWRRCKWCMLGVGYAISGRMPQWLKTRAHLKEFYRFSYCVPHPVWY
jgi:hypothetical protein